MDNNEKEPEFILGSNVRDNILFPQGMMNDFVFKTIAEWEEKLKTYLKENLRQHGYEFTSDESFINFCKERIVRICFEDKPNYYEFYLDYVNENNFGKLIGSYSDMISIYDIIKSTDELFIRDR